MKKLHYVSSVIVYLEFGDFKIIIPIAFDWTRFPFQLALVGWQWYPYNRWADFEIGERWVG